MLALLALLFSQRLAQVPHAFAQGFHGLGLTVDGPGQIIFAQRVFRPFHRALGAVERVFRGPARLGALPGQIAALAVQLVAQRALAVSQAVFQRLLPALTLLLALTLSLALTLTLLPLAAALLLLTLALLPLLLALLTLLSLLAFAVLAGIELLLQVAERLITQSLLFTQSF